VAVVVDTAKRVIKLQEVVVLVVIENHLEQHQEVIQDHL
tara:strand:+ start:107 stop:223 length:117 start_codon:yes stop_codon:yes gene_type:complete